MLTEVRVAFFGTEGVFSRAPLAALRGDGCALCAVIVPRPSGMTAADAPVRRLPPPPRSALPLLAVPVERTIVGMAWAWGVPVLEVASLTHGRTLAVLAAARPEVICTACFPGLLPRAVLDLPRLGALNVHPSMLPEYRGPAPLFWVFHDGLERAGVTVHVMDENADTGAIAFQTAVALRDGSSYGQAERRCSEEGARLLVEAVRALAAGTLIGRPQPRLNAPAAPFPRDADFVVTPDWPARRAFDFIRGMEQWGRAVELHVRGERFVVREAVSFDDGAVMNEPVERSGQCLRMRCEPGVLAVTTY